MSRPRRLRIAVISTMTSWPWGGSEELWAAMAGEALEQGHGVVVSVPRWPTVPRKIRRLEQRGASILRRRRGMLFGRLYPRIGGGLAPWSPFRAVFQARPDVICISQGWSYDAAYLPDLLRLVEMSAKPYVVICQGWDDSYVPGQELREPLAAFLSSASRVVVVSERGVPTLERQLARRLSNTVVVQAPPNLASFEEQPWPSSGPARMACVGFLRAAVKGQDILFQALSAPEWRARDWLLSVCGEGPDREYLESLAGHYGISGRVRFRGFVEDVRAIWGDNEILVHPSRGEGGPLVLREAMLCGRPAVATNVGGVADWVEEGRTGFIAECPTSRSLGAALERAWQARPDWEAMGRRAHDRAIDQLDPTPGRSLLQVVLTAAADASPRARGGPAAGVRNQLRRQPGDAGS